MKDLTQKQQQVLTFLKKHAAQYGYPPTVREIGRQFGILWPAARGHLQALAKKGAIKLNPAVSRGLSCCHRNTLKASQCRLQAG